MLGMSTAHMLIKKGTNQEQTSFQHTRHHRHYKHQLPGTFWVNRLQLVFEAHNDNLHNVPPDQMTDVTEAFYWLQRFSWCPKSYLITLMTELWTRYTAQPRQLKDGAPSVAKLSDLNSSFEIVNLNSTVSQPQTHYCNAWGGGVQQNLKMFPSGSEDPAAYYFPCFSWRSLYWDFAI